MVGQGDAIRNLVDRLITIVHNDVEIPASVPRDVAVPNIKWIHPDWLWSIYCRAKQWLRYRKSDGIEPEFLKDVFPDHVNEARISKWTVLFAKENE